MPCHPPEVATPTKSIVSTRIGIDIAPKVQYRQCEHGAYAMKRVTSGLNSPATPLTRIKVALPERPIEGIFLSDVYVTPTHFWNGRTTPCVRGMDCEACDSGSSARTVGYFLAIDDSRQEVFVGTIPYYACQQLSEYLAKNGSILGRAFVIERIGKTKRSRCRIKIAPVRSIDDVKQYCRIRLDRILSAIFGKPCHFDD